MRSILIGCLFLLTACKPSVPSEFEARNSLVAHEAGLRAIRERVEKSVRDARIDDPRECKPDVLRAPGLTPAEAVDRLTACSRAKDERYRRIDTLRADLGEKILPKLTDDAKALGICLKLRHKTAPANELITSLASEPCPPGSGNGTVEAKNGPTIDAYRLGCGIYQTAWENAGGKHGDGKFHRGIEVAWSQDIGDTVAMVDVFFLDDGTPRP
jgi:hypothetical protein